MHKTTRHAIQQTIRQAIDDLYALAKEADSEDAEHIYEIIERLERFNEEDEKKSNCSPLAMLEVTRPGVAASRRG